VFPQAETLPFLMAVEVQFGPHPKVPIFAESETRFFATMVDAQIGFRKDAAGAVVGLVLHQGPVNLEAQRKTP
jgi:hypothetical protein